MLKLVKIDGLLLLYADDDFKIDRDIVLAAVKQNGYALEYIGNITNYEILKEIVLVAIDNEPTSIIHAPSTIRNDREIALAAVRKDGTVLALLSGVMRRDPEIIDAAVNNNPEARRYAIS